MESEQRECTDCENVQKHTYRMYVKKDKAYSSITTGTEKHVTLICHGCVAERQLEKNYENELLEMGHKVEYVTKLKQQDEKFRNDFNVVMHAKNNGMILITKDKEPGQACKDNEIPCIWLSDEKIFNEMVMPRLDDFQRS